jgi:hypothetical protein
VYDPWPYCYVRCEVSDRDGQLGDLCVSGDVYERGSSGASDWQADRIVDSTVTHPHSSPAAQQQGSPQISSAGLCQQVTGKLPEVLDGTKIEDVSKAEELMLPQRC